MAIRITGLNSGLDTDSIVQELVSAYSTKKDKYVKAQTKLSWKQDTWKEMNTKIYGFYSKSLWNMTLAGNYNKKTTVVSDSTKAKVTAAGSVVNGTQKLSVKQLATAGYLTGTKVAKESGEKLKATDKLSELGVKDGTLKLMVGTETKEVKVTSDMTITDFTDALKEQGINASFDAGQQRFFLNSASSGEENDFHFVIDNGDQEGMLNLKKLGLLSAQDVIKASAEKTVEDSVQRRAAEKAVADGKVTGVTTDQFNVMTDAEKKTVFEQLSESDKQTYRQQAETELIKELDAQDGVTDSTLDYTDRSYIEKRLKELGEACYDELMAKNYDTMKDSYAAKTDASNAVIELNGARFESSSNKFSINGLEITATGTNAEGEEMTITTETDVDGIYNMIKDFLKEYNTLVNSMEKAYNAKSAKGYEPLTDDEKDEMSDTEIEKWETKIKDSLLRRDDTLNSVLSGMSMSMSKSFEINGKSYNLSSFGISTSGYFTKVENESYAYHIDGDADDSSVSGNTDKLRKAIEDDPDSVMQFFSQLSKGVYANLKEKMGGTELSSTYTVYNDKQMQKEYDEYTQTIKKWEEKLKDMEDYYYKKFSAMETALAKLQSQTNSLSSLLGG